MTYFRVDGAGTVQQTPFFSFFELEDGVIGGLLGGGYADLRVTAYRTLCPSDSTVAAVH